MLNILHNPFPGGNLLWDGFQLRNVFITQIVSFEKVLVWLKQTLKLNFRVFFLFFKITPGENISATQLSDM